MQLKCDKIYIHIESARKLGITVYIYLITSIAVRKSIADFSTYTVLISYREIPTPTWHLTADFNPCAGDLTTSHSHTGRHDTKV